MSHRNLLEWVPVAQAGAGRSLTLSGFYGQMAGALVIAVLALAVSLASGNGTWPLALFFGLVWFTSPAIALRVSLAPRLSGLVQASADDAEALRLAARRTWRFFESFVTPGDNMLPPDNFQETPEPVIAHRSSPTNFGLYLLSCIAARDFGWIGLAELTDRIEATSDTLLRLPRYRGHFFNWYETRELRPLDPKYVSTVDSGNLAGHLLTVAQGCDDAIRQPLISIFTSFS